MRALQTLLMLFGALAVLMLGSAPAGAAGTTPSCHETVAASQEPGDAHSPNRPGSVKALSPMACCTACVAAAAPAAPGDYTFIPSPCPVSPCPAPFMTGLSPAPEPGPPRL